ncbi:MAG: hypothetical protein ACFNL5_07100, partial [Rothia dentocariosa]
MLSWFYLYELYALWREELVAAALENGALGAKMSGGGLGG